MMESLGERVAFGIVAGAVAALAVVLAEFLDFAFWELGLVEADSFGDYLRKVWWLPLDFAMAGFWLGVKKGSNIFTKIRKLALDN